MIVAPIRRPMHTLHLMHVDRSACAVVDCHGTVPRILPRGSWDFSLNSRLQLIS